MAAADVEIDLDPEKKEHMAKVLSIVASMAGKLADRKTEAVVVALVGRCNLTLSDPR